MRLVLLLPLLIVATPSAAQIWDRGRSVDLSADATPVDPDGFARDRDMRRVVRSIRDGVRRGELTRREARDLRAQAAAIGRSPSSGGGTQQAGMVPGLRGLVDARRAQGRAAKAATGR